MLAVIVSADTHVDDGGVSRECVGRRTAALPPLLHATGLPPVGGDTQFANTAMGYAALPEVTKREIAGFKAVHSREASRRNTGGRLATRKKVIERPPVDSSASANPP